MAVVTADPEDSGSDSEPELKIVMDEEPAKENEVRSISLDIYDLMSNRRNSYFILAP